MTPPAVLGGLLLVVAGVAGAAGRPVAPQVDPGRTSAEPTAVVRARPAVVGLRGQVPADRRSAATLGRERWGTAVILEADGLAVTVGYLVLEAETLEATLADGRHVAAEVVGHDFESGLALVALDPKGAPYPVARLGQSSTIRTAQAVAIVGVPEEGAPAGIAARVIGVRPFVAYWEYLLEQALIVAPHHPAFGGAALVDADGALVGVVSLRLGEGHLAIPIDLLAPVRADLVARGRPARPGRPWLGVRTAAVAGGVGIASVTPDSPAQAAGLQPGDVVVRLAGARVADVEDFYRKLWAAPLGRPLELGIYRGGQLETVTVALRDRYAVFRLRTR